MKDVITACRVIVDSAIPRCGIMCSLIKYGIEALEKFVFSLQSLVKRTLMNSAAWHPRLGAVFLGSFKGVSVVDFLALLGLP